MHFSPTTTDFSPITLSFVASLRGVKPREVGLPFTYARIVGNEEEASALLALAASNPEGSFYGLTEIASLEDEMKKIATTRGVGNISFLRFAPGEAFTKLPPLDYLVADVATPVFLVETLRPTAHNALKEGGLFVCRYETSDEVGKTLRYLTEVAASDLAPSQSVDFLEELLSLNLTFFEKNEALKDTIKESIEKRAPELFFEAVRKQFHQSVSGIMEILPAFLDQGLTLVGDAALATNYPEACAPQKVRDLLVEMMDLPYYEALKDFALGRVSRADIYCKLPAELTENPAELFGRWTYGTTAPLETLPSKITIQEKTIDLQKAPYANLLKVFTTLPALIGDFLSHPEGKGLDPEEVLTAIHRLVAAGLLRPMRSRCQGTKKDQMAHPKWAVAYNAYAAETPLTTAKITLASEVLGGTFDVSLRDLLVLRAINEAGLSGSSDAILPALKQLAETKPALAAQMMDVAAPTADTAAVIVLEVLNRSLIRWYAYGVLAA